MLSARRLSRGLLLVPMFPFAGSPAAVLATAACLALTAPALAQVKDVAPYTAAATIDNVTVRCGSGFYYKVAELAKGQTVKVDGEDNGWLRIEYPAGTAAFIKDEDGKLDEASGTVKLTKPSALWAFNVTGGVSPSASWKALMPSPLPEGSSFKLVEALKDGGKVVGYKVVAPANAHGFVEGKFLRKAGSDEASAPAAKPAAKPDGAKPEPAVLEPMVPPGSPPVQAAPTAAPTPAPTNEAAPVTISQGGAAQPVVEVAPANPAQRRVGTLDQLEATFQAVRTQPEATAELDALYAELQRAAEQTANDPNLKGRRVQLERRRDYVKLRMDLRDKARAIEDAKRSIDEGNDRLKLRIAELERQRVYTIIGLLVPSTVYDGNRLPLMYRLQAVGTSAPPTVGYLAPKPELNLKTKLGMVVGVVGEQTMDRSLNLNVINPMRVDVLQGAPGQGEITPEK